MMQSSNIVDSSKVEDFRVENGDVGNNRSSVDKFPNGVKLERSSTPSSYDVNMMDVNGLGAFNGMNQIEPHRAIDPDSLLNPSHLHSTIPNRSASSVSVLETNNDDIKAINDINNNLQNSTQNDQVVNDKHEINVEQRRASNVAANEPVDHASLKDDNANVSPTVRSQQQKPDVVSSHSNQVIPNGAVESNAAVGGFESGAKTELLFASSSKAIRNYSVEYSFKKIKPAYLIDSSGFLEYTKVFILFFLNLFVLLPFVCILALIFMPYKVINA